MARRFRENVRCSILLGIASTRIINFFQGFLSYFMKLEILEIL
jgi:hypothetical protein